MSPEGGAGNPSDSWDELLLTSFPCIGPKRAKRILEKWPRCTLALDHVDEWSTEVKGIGAKISRMVKEMLEEECSGS
jgi:ERCC4-type nuclease